MNPVPIGAMAERSIADVVVWSLKIRNRPRSSMFDNGRQGQRT